MIFVGRMHGRQFNVGTCQRFAIWIIFGSIWSGHRTACLFQTRTFVLKPNANLFRRQADQRAEFSIVIVYSFHKSEKKLGKKFKKTKTEKSFQQQKTDRITRRFHFLNKSLIQNQCLMFGHIST